VNLSAPFVRRPIGTTLLTAGVALAGGVAFFLMPVSALPSVDYPTIQVQASLPGASPETMASSVATPLERRLGHIADVSEMTSSSGAGSTQIVLQFNLNRNIDGAARDVQAAINAARVDLPATLRQNPTYRKANPSDSPIMILALTSKSKTTGQIYDAASTIIQQQLSQIKGVGDVEIGGGSLPAVRVELNPLALAKYGIALEDVRAALASANANRPKGIIGDGPQRLQIYTNDQSVQAADFRPLIIAYRNNAAVRLQDVADVQDGVEDVHNLGLFACGPPPGTPYPTMGSFRPGQGGRPNFGGGGPGGGGFSGQGGGFSRGGFGPPGGQASGPPAASSAPTSGAPGSGGGFRRWGGGAGPPSSGAPAGAGGRFGGAQGGPSQEEQATAVVPPMAGEAPQGAGAQAGSEATGSDQAADGAAPGGARPPWAGRFHRPGGAPPSSAEAAGAGQGPASGPPAGGFRRWQGGAPPSGAPGGQGGRPPWAGGQGGPPGGAQGARPPWAGRFPGGFPGRGGFPGGFRGGAGGAPGAGGGEGGSLPLLGVTPPESAQPGAGGFDRSQWRSRFGQGRGQAQGQAPGQGRPPASSTPAAPAAGKANTQLSAACANTDGPQPAVVVQVRRQPGANIIATVDRIKKTLPIVEAALPQDITVTPAIDRTTTIRASLVEVERTLLIAIVLVVLVVAFFLKSARATLVPAVAVAVSLLGGIGMMYLLGFSLDNLSLMALTVATGFVVDDAIVVLENISRHIEEGMPRYKAALLGAREVGFTVMSISISLMAVFIPILMMGGIIGRLFREFAITLSMAVLVSLLVSLTTTPMICAYMLRPDNKSARKAPGWWVKASDGVFNPMKRAYEKALDWSLDNGPTALAILVCTIVLNIYLWSIIPKGFFPQQDTGMLMGGMQADQASSFAISQQRLTRFINIIARDPALSTVVGFVNGGRGGGGGGFMFMAMKPKNERKGGADELMMRLRPQFGRITGASAFLAPVQDVRVGGRQSNASYQYTLEGPDLATLRTWATRLSEAMMGEPALTDVNTDQQDHGLQSYVNVNRDTAAQLGLTSAEVDNTLYDAFGQRQVATIYKAQNQYHVIMEAGPQYIQSPDALSNIYVSSSAAQRAVATRLSQGGYSIPGYSTLSAAARATGGGGGGGGGAATLTTTSGGGGAAVSGPSGTGEPPPAATSEASATNASSFTTAPANFAAPSLSASTAAGGGGGGAAAGSSSNTNLIGATAPPSRGASSGLAISTSAETMTPLSAFASWADGSQPRSVNHQDESIATTISFNLAQGKSLSDAVSQIHDAEEMIGMPPTVHGSFQGTAKVFQDSLANEPVLILTAIVCVYIVLGILYESYIHPLTVISTLPSAGVGAVTALLLFKTEYSIIALIGVILLIGIVKKNAIMIIDFALDAERAQGCTTREAIRQACLLRFRPIMMTTFAAILGAVPLVVAWGEGSELRRPLGMTIIGGLLVSQILTLITTPVVYLYLDRFRKRSPHERQLSRGVGAAPTPPEQSETARA
jgi:multidrug efflux pump